MKTGDVTAAIRQLKERLSTVQAASSRAAAEVGQAEQALATAEETLADLGFDPAKPLAPQIERALRQAETKLVKVEKVTRDAQGQLGAETN